MRPTFRAFLLTLALGLAAPLAEAAPAHEPAQPIAWRSGSDDVFAQAKAQNKYVLLDLGAVWCHWCHVMDETTYRDPAVVAMIASHYIPVRVDQDSRPDLSRRYEAFGWPATIVMDAQGRDIGKMRGYREPARFLHTLQAILDDPSPLGNDADEDRTRRFSAASRLADSTRAEIEVRFDQALDLEHGGLKQDHRYLARDQTDHAMARAARGDPRAEQWLRTTLDAARGLIDPAWGGMYQYSTDGDWRHPHYEKIMEVQAAAMTAYARAYARGGRPEDLDAAQAVRAYLKAFLTSPEGAFYTSQDADLRPGEQGDGYFALGDAERRARGIPRIDRHVYARENGWAIEALAELYGATGDEAVLDEALRAARWTVAHRGRPDGGFRHDERDLAGPYLGDSLAMGRAMLALHAATGERIWLDRARAVRPALAMFRAPLGAGYLPTPTRPAATLTPRPHLDENVEVARFANLLARYTGDPRDRAAAEAALGYIGDAGVALRPGLPVGVLLAGDEAAGEPLHITVVGGKRDARALALYRAALRQPAAYRRIEWWDPSQGRLLNPDAQYPKTRRPAAFVCAERTCSLPLFEPQAIAEHLAALREVVSKGE